MEVTLTPEQEAQLNEMAAASGRPAQQILQEALTRFFEYQKQLEGDIEEAIRSIESGNYLEQEEVEARIEARFRGLE